MDARQRRRGGQGAPGGIEGLPEVEQAATLCSLGLDGIGWLEISDPVDQLVTLAVAKKLAPIRAEEREDLAVRMVNTLGRAMKK